MKKWTIEIICLLYMLLFIYAAVSKLADYHQFTEQLRESPFRKYATLIALLTPASELLLSLLLILRKVRKIALFGSFLLMMAFTVYIIYILKYASDIPCSCGGILENMNWTQHLAFNIIFTLLALIALILHKKKQPTPLILQESEIFIWEYGYNYYHSYCRCSLSCLDW